MEMIIYTFAALVLYFLSDWILNQVEMKLGKRLAHRSLIFFAIIFTLAALSFNVIKSVYKPIEPTTTNSQPTAE